MCRLLDLCIPFTLHGFCLSRSLSEVDTSRFPAPHFLSIYLLVL